MGFNIYFVDSYEDYERLYKNKKTLPAHYINFNKDNIPEEKNYDNTEILK